MTVVWRRCARLPRPPLVPALAFGAWAGAIVALSVAGGGAASSPCWFRHATGLPCPTCGGTRCVTAAWRGDLAEAVASNPFVALALLALGAHLLLRLASGRRPGIDGLSSGRLWLAAGAALAVNWAYLLARAG